MSVRQNPIQVTTHVSNTESHPGDHLTNTLLANDLHNSHHTANQIMINAKEHCKITCILMSFVPDIQDELNFPIDNAATHAPEAIHSRL